jgi:hypothetical protein
MTNGGNYNTILHKIIIYSSFLHNVLKKGPNYVTDILLRHYSLLKYIDPSVHAAVQHTAHQPSDYKSVL